MTSISLYDDDQTDYLIGDEESSKISRKSSTISREVTETELVYHELEYVIPVKEKKVKFNKTILTGCSGIMRPGLNAIMGPTGSGKTTLLDILAGRKDKRFLKGHVFVNGISQTNDFKLSSGFVVQDDVVMGTLTVRENLYFSANLRLPSTFSSSHRKDRVETIIKDLQLTLCADTLVGAQNRRGISGGERKRTCIGMELVTSPNVLFLDEPTTGLDASTAVVVMKLLRKQAAKGRTIIFSIHQPRYSIFKLFDNLTLLVMGQTVYNGEAKMSMAYFESLGYMCETFNNPADFYMDVLSDEKMSVEDGVNKEEAVSNESLVKMYKNSDMYVKTMSEIKSVYDSSKYIDEVEIRNKNQYPSSFFRQIRFLSVRSMKNMVRDPRGLISQLFVGVVNAAITGAIYWRLKKDSAGIQNREGLFYFILMNQVFSNLSAISIFYNERPIFRNECSNGYYRISSYFLSKLFFDVLPLRILPLIIFSLMVYFMTGLKLGVDNFFIFVVSLLTANLTGSSICIFVSSSTSNIAVANLLVTLPFVFMQVFSGFLLNLASITKVLRWLQYLSIFRYSLASLEINELKGMTFSDCPTKNQTCTGDEHLRKQGFDSTLLWLNQVILISAASFLYFLAYLQLRRMKKTN